MADAVALQMYVMVPEPFQVDGNEYIFHLDLVVWVVPLFEQAVLAHSGVSHSEDSDETLL